MISVSIRYIRGSFHPTFEGLPGLCGTNVSTIPWFWNPSIPLACLCVCWGAGGSPSFAGLVTILCPLFSILSIRSLSPVLPKYFAYFGCPLSPIDRPFSCPVRPTKVRLITWRMCLVGVKMSAYSKCDWLSHDSRILTNVAMFRTHNVRRVLHIPLVIVHPIWGWASVVSPSCVMIENPSIFSFHKKDLRCICTHPRPLSSRGQGPLKDPSDSEILVLESVTWGGWLVITGFGSDSHVALSWGSSLRQAMLPGYLYIGMYSTPCFL